MIIVSQDKTEIINFNNILKIEVIDNEIIALKNYFWYIRNARGIDMRYPRLIKSCEEAIKNEWCLGCQALEDINFRGRYNCKYSFPPKTKKVEKSINEIHRYLGIQEKMKI